MDRLEAMSAFVAAVETGSLTAASRRLNTPLPTVSRKLAELEAHLATRLLVRSTRRLALTDAGSAYFQSCKRILDEVAEAERVAIGEQSAPKGDLVMTAPIVFGRLHILPLVNEFLSLYPEIDIKLLLSDRNTDLFEDHIDIAIRIGTLPDSSMVATRVGHVRRVVCGSPEFFDRHGMPDRPEDLTGKPAVSFDALGPTSWAFTQPGKRRERAVEVHSRLSVNTAEAALDAAIAGVGLTRVLSYQAAGPVGKGLLQVVLEVFEPEALPVHVIHRAQGSLPFKLRSFLDFAAPKLRRRLDELSLFPHRPED